MSRVLHAHSGNIFGGIESALVAFATTPGSITHEFALCFEGRLARAVAEAGCTVHRLGSVKFSRPWTVRRVRQAFRRLLDASPPDAVVCHAPWSLALFGPPTREHGVAPVQWVHGILRGRHWLERLARRTVPALAICNSDYTRQAYERAFPGVPTTVIYNPVRRPREDTAAGSSGASAGSSGASVGSSGALAGSSDALAGSSGAWASSSGDRTGSSGADRVHAVRASLDTSDDAVVITQVSRPEPWKGQRVLLDALAALRDDPTWACWLVGGGERRSERAYQASLERRAAALGIHGRIRFLGERGDVPDILAASDIFCQPNTGPEPFGIVFVEALYQRLPVVTTAIGGAAEIITPECGRLVRSDDAIAVAGALRHLIEDPSERARLGANGPARAAALCDPVRQTERLAETLAGLRTRDG